MTPTDAAAHAARNALADLIRDLPQLDVTAPRPAAQGTPPPAGASPAIPGGLTRLHLVETVHGIVFPWCALVISRREILGHIGSTTIDRCRFLARHIDWLADHDPAAIDACAQELTAIAAAVRRAVSPPTARVVPIGACPATGCVGVLHVRLPDRTRPARTRGAAFTTQTTAAPAGDPQAIAQCDHDHTHTWAVTDPRLATLMGLDGPERMSVPQWIAWVQQHWRTEIPTDTVRAWTRRRPHTIGWDTHTTTLDRVATTMHWLDTRARKATR